MYPKKMHVDRNDVYIPQKMSNRMKGTGVSESKTLMAIVGLFYNFATSFTVELEMLR